jgi:cytochrome c-type biogenesis protein CcmH/NrfG
MGLGNSAHALGDMVTAERAFRNATRAHPDSAAAFNNLADTLARLQRYPEALQAAQEAVRLGGDQPLYARTLAEIQASIARQKRSGARASRSKTS